ncbi:MAG: long-chain-fatty-acid--CoA ligase [Gammaproteobacteria bacterium]|nr:long-chain-fatty-acid--CoA ligase [Gammaproteobacteria bacterium]NND39021.1 long-chain-fatty-acid--CoA ligase [Pseudomonadales bacterium]MBT8151199.1 long-chain-fatty-acid--CoA ligase [Gammaproteobacteria bacterium]NNL11391.1 long-chain-fatty-acid--CoA ligase [Pseudomonadales bacterium]NNM10482.1 long-chain-fatty-acid--CoA ligase [Pseudomonadales bacterium]
MLGHMMQQELMISDLLTHAEKAHGSREIVSREADGTAHRYTWAECAARAKQLANALLAAGVKPGDRVATIAWNTYRHIEIYYAVSGIGAIVHTINPRLDPKQVSWMMDHAEDCHVLFDTTFAPIVAAVREQCPAVKSWIALCDTSKLPQDAGELIAYEEFIAAQSDEFEWPRFDENTACTLCYTSGTTGNPKGVLYSHRSTVLHAWCGSTRDALGIGAVDSILAVVPMFHVSAWGLIYAAAMVGAKLVMPGANLDGENLANMINKEKVTLMAGVPTVWLGVLQHCRANKVSLPSVQGAIVGGSALPESLLRAYEEELDIPMRQAWGMTETSPIGVVNAPLPAHDALPGDELVKVKLLQGRRIFGVQMRILDDDGKQLPEDGEVSGHLQVRGPWVASGYFKGAGADAFTDDGWFNTGDVAAIHPDGYMEITDRSKDVIKSGGEWISSIDVENAACNHPDVAMAACIGVPHPKWDERPLLIVQPVPGKKPPKEEVFACIAEKCAKWWVPEDMVYEEVLPIGPTGKILKRELKDKYNN